ncbi:MAG TPA: hypothetical protein VFL83_13740 [Anaeromyxobacter sp.]|nr:hypothetical protein [Anaeromyxobacter sp.]
MPFSLVVTLLLAVPLVASADPAGCPPGRDQIAIRVSAGVRYDLASALYTYSYAVRNDPSSAQEVKTFAVDVIGTIPQIESPEGWRGRIHEIRPWVYWRAYLLADPDRISGDGRLSPSIVQIKPGSALGGFSFRSPKPPGTVAFHATGFRQLPAATGATPEEAELEAERLAEYIRENCPKQARPLIDQGIVGATIGPVEATPVQIDVKPDDAVNAVNPASHGVIPVAVLGSATFDPRTIDMSSIALVPSGARPRKSAHEDVNRDGRPDLLLHFGTADAAITCGDSALVFAAKSTRGGVLSAFDTIRTTGCR